MIKSASLFLLRGYKRFISPMLGDHCRFYPSCASYTHDAILLHGVARGIYLGGRRLLKCQPFHPGGYDPVPEKFEVKIKWIQKG